MRRKLISIALVALLCSFQVSFASAANISESSNGKTISVKLGKSFKVLLHSTAWTLNPLTDKNLVQVGDPAITATPPGPSAPAGCQVPGMSCGTIQWTFKGTKAGISSLLFNRSSCGEAKRCTVKESIYKVIIRVTK
jgi:hypothetical protein